MTRRQGLRALGANQRSDGQASAKVAQARSSRTGCDDGGSTRLISYTNTREGSDSPATMVEVLEQESKEPFTPSPSLIYQIVAGESYINCTVFT